MIGYIVYITTNTCNGKFYIGVHKTDTDVFDGYIGCGIYRQSNANKDFAFHRAVRKYGYDSFVRTTIKIFDNTNEGKHNAYEFEKQLVTEQLVNSKMCYNEALGGSGSVSQDLLKQVYMFSLHGELLMTFKSVRDAALYLNPSNIESTLKAIRNNCLGVTKSSYGYFWSYNQTFEYTNENLRKVWQYTLKGKFIRTFDSVSEAESILNLHSIYQAATKHFNCGGFQWRFDMPNNNDIGPLVNIFTRVNSTPIIMIDINTNKEEYFNSIKECISIHNELSVRSINNVLSRKSKTHKGYIFKYSEDIV